MEHINRFGEINPKPSRGGKYSDSLDWSHDPRSESAYENHQADRRENTDFSSDEEIKEKAQIAISMNPEVDESRIEVSVDSGVVSLHGLVMSRKEKVEAERCVEQLDSVEDILNYIEINSENDSAWS